MHELEEWIQVVTLYLLPHIINLILLQSVMQREMAIWIVYLQCHCRLDQDVNGLHLKIACGISCNRLSIEVVSFGWEPGYIYVIDKDLNFWADFCVMQRPRKRLRDVKGLSIKLSQTAVQANEDTHLYAVWWSLLKQSGRQDEATCLAITHLVCLPCTECGAWTFF